MTKSPAQKVAELRVDVRRRGNEKAIQTLAAVQQASDEMLRIARLNAKAAKAVNAVNAAVKEQLIADVLGQIHEDAARGRESKLMAVLHPTRLDGQEIIAIEVSDPHFIGYKLPVEELRAAAKAIPDESSRRLLGRIGVLEVVNQIVTNVPDAAITLTDHSWDDNGGYS